MVKLTAVTKTAFLSFVENFGDRMFIGAATVYIAKGGNINTINDLKAVAIAGVLAGITWALGAAKSRTV